MHKTYLNEIELQLIKGADKIIEKIGGFPSMENGRLTDISIHRGKEFGHDIELVFDLTGWIHVLDFHYSYDYEGDMNYYHREFDERHIKMIFHSFRRIEMKGFPSFDFDGGEIKFGGIAQEDSKCRYQDRLPGHNIVIERPYTCFYIRSGCDFVIYFDENECEISAELFK
ncbi:MAG: hypothetical protein IKE50_02760 [Erysipelotrichaceae bacterium]|nr:hypothetical protein [Erysipelotrichaceae bacterium]